MLHGLFGSKSVERILLFLLVNERAYATQLHRILNTPLTPIQKALLRLEQDGILCSSLDGKRRVYTFDPEYPLLVELEALLKKAYTKLAPAEKKNYYYIRHIPKPNKQLLEEVWSALRSTERVTFRFKSRQTKGEGAGQVEVVYDGDARCSLYERGAWRGLNDQEFTFRNVFRWTYNRFEGMLTLEHLRFGERNPVFLFHLVPAGEKTLESLHAHLCGEDTYFGHLVLKSNALELTWRILGPKKNDEVCYIYT